MKPDDNLRLRALSKTKGDYEAHEVAASASYYLSACQRDDLKMSDYWEKRLRMFVDTNLSWKAACTAVGRSTNTPGAKALGRIWRRLGHGTLPVDTARIRQNNRRNGD